MRKLYKGTFILVVAVIAAGCATTKMDYQMGNKLAERPVDYKELHVVVVSATHDSSLTLDERIAAEWKDANKQGEAEPSVVSYTKRAAFEGLESVIKSVELTSNQVGLIIVNKNSASQWTGDTSCFSTANTYGTGTVDQYGNINGSSNSYGSTSCSTSRGVSTSNVLDVLLLDDQGAVYQGKYQASSKNNEDDRFIQMLDKSQTSEGFVASAIIDDLRVNALLTPKSK